MHGRTASWVEGGGVFLHGEGAQKAGPARAPAGAAPKYPLSQPVQKAVATRSHFLVCPLCATMHAVCAAPRVPPS